MAQETGVQSQVESYQRLKKWFLMPPCLTFSIIRYRSRVKWSNSGKGVDSSLHLGVVAIQVTLDYGRQLYLLYKKRFQNVKIQCLLHNYGKGIILNGLFWNKKKLSM